MIINYSDFNKQFNKEYEFLYECRDNVSGFQEAVDAFDEYIKKKPQARFVANFAQYRGDYITSDWEAAAFMFALSTFA